MSRLEILRPWTGRDVAGPRVIPQSSGLPVEIPSFGFRESLILLAVLQERIGQDGSRPVCLEAVFQESFEGLSASLTIEQVMTSYSSIDKF